jgi:hypothetical protein
MLNKRRLPYWSGKLSYQMNLAHRFGAFYHDAKELERRSGSRFVPAESREVYEGPLATWGGSWQVVRGNSLVASLGILCTFGSSALPARKLSYDGSAKYHAFW